MLVIGIILMVLGVISTVMGSSANNNLGSQIESFLSSGNVNTGDIWIYLGIAMFLGGLALTIAGGIRMSKRKSTVAQNGYTPSPYINPNTPYTPQNTVWFCDKCGTQNNSSFCSACGNKKPEIIRAAVPTYWYCTKCGAKHTEQETMCACGQQRPI